MKIIDAHSHYMPPEVARNTMFFKAGWSDVDRQLKAMDEGGVEKALLLYPTSDAHLNMGGWKNVCRIYNEAIAAVVAKHPSRFIGAGILPPASAGAGENSTDLNEELKRFTDLNLPVISLASSYDGKYLDDEMFFPAYVYAQEHNTPIHVHSQIINPVGEDRVRDPLLTPVLEYVLDVSMCIGKLMMSATFLKFPDVKFIFAHYGGVLPLVKERFDTTYQMLRKRNFVKDLTKAPGDYFKNLYFDTSGSKSLASLLCALEMVDASHILFASDYPANPNFTEAVAMIKNASISDSDKHVILRNSLLENL